MSPLQVGFGLPVQGGGDGEGRGRTVSSRWQGTVRSPTRSVRERINTDESRCVYSQTDKVRVPSPTRACNTPVTVLRAEERTGPLSPEPLLEDEGSRVF